MTLQPSSGWSALNLREIWQFRELLITLAVRDLKLRYKQTMLGVIWVILQPLLAAAIFAFVFGRVARLPTDGIAAFPFAYSGLLAWNLFSNALTRSSSCLIGNAPLIAKIYFPRIVLPLSTVLSALVDFAVASVLMVGIQIAYGLEASLPLMLLPVWVFGLLLLALGLGFAASSLSVTYRDVNHVLPVATQMLLYASPVAYALSAIPEDLRTFYSLNPLVSLLEAFRWSLLGGTEPPATGPLIYALTVSAVVFVAGAVTFKLRERRFADVI